MLKTRSGKLELDGVDVAELVQRVGSPAYLYSRATVTRNVRALEAGLDGSPHLLCYAIKASSAQALLELTTSLGCGLDAGSLGELARALMTRTPASRIVLTGLGKSDAELEAAVHAGVRYVCIESASELDALNRAAVRVGRRAAASLRVNPDVDAKTHPHIATGLAEHKFGVSVAEEHALAGGRQRRPQIDWLGISCHVGSQITSLEPFAAASKRMLELAGALERTGLTLTHLGLGGGLGIRYTNESPPTRERYARALARAVAPTGRTLVLELGRAIVGDAGWLATRVVRIKAGAKRPIVVLDAGMNDLLRPALYGARHEVLPVQRRAGARRRYDVVGPVCESSDVFWRDTALPLLAEGDLVLLANAGAYGHAMSSTYNGRPRLPEVLCGDGRALIMRRRERLEDLWRGEARLGGGAVTRTMPRALSARSKRR